MTEEEAKQRWCPMVRHPIEREHYSGSFNRGAPPDYVNMSQDSDLHCNCIASDCMMWKPQHKHNGSVDDFDILVVGGRCGLSK